MKKLTLMGSLAGALLATSGMQAVTISLTLQEEALAPITASSTTGVVSIVNPTYDDFALHSVTGLGTAFYSTPELNLQTLNVPAPT